MKKIVRRGSMLAIAATAIMMSSCTKNFDFSVPENNVNDEYAKGWENAFGEIDSNQDWNLASQVTLKNPMASSNASSVLVYDAMPGKSTTHLIGEFDASAEDLTFDCTKGTTSVYIVGKDAAGKIIAADYFPVSSTKSVNKAMTRAGETTTSLGDKITEIGSFHDANDTWNGSYWDSPYWHSIQFKNVFDLYNLNNVSTSPASSWKISDIVGIVGQGGVFNEQGKDENGNCNLKHWESQLKPSEGAEYVMESDGPMEISFMYGGTIKFNKFGYLYYKDGASEEEILKAPRYILMDDGRPQGNITVDGTQLGESDGMKLPGIVESYEKYNGSNSTLVGTTYKLAYFGEDGHGEGSYTFPKGTHVVFFIIIGNNNAWYEPSQYGTNIRYSLPWMNGKFYYKQYENHPSYVVEDEAKDFVTYKWGGQIVMGVEDEGGDDDMNDILFFIKGNVKDDDIPEIGEDPEENSWIIACEDLGDTDDYDFNDVVFKVSHVSGQTTATVTPLAAGGTLETFIIHNNSYLGETHQLLGAKQSASGSYPMINTSKITATATPLEVTVAEDFTITKNMGGFGILVKGKNGDSNATLITAPTAGTAPQMFCVPATWAWPTERTKIQDAYPDFAKWSADSNNIEWYNNSVADKVIGGGAQ